MHNLVKRFPTYTTYTQSIKDVPKEDLEFVCQEKARARYLSNKISQLSKNQKSVNAQDEDGNIPLYYPVMQQNPYLVKLLLGAGSDPCIQNVYTISPLSLAETFLKDNDKINCEIINMIRKAVLGKNEVNFSIIVGQ